MSSRSSSASSSSSSNSDSDKKNSGSERSRSPSPAGSRSASEKSRTSSRSRSRSAASSSSGSSSPRFVSATSSDASKASSTSSRGRKKVKAKDRKASNKLSEKIRHSDDSEDEQQSSEDDRKRKPAAKKASGSKGKKGKKNQSEEEGEIGSDEDKEFDDGLDEDLIGDDEDRARLEDMTEREREEELFKRAENREHLRKRFEIQKKLKQQQKLKQEEKKDRKKVSDSEEEEGQRSDSGDSEKEKRDKKKDSDESGDEVYGYGTIQDAKERAQDRRKNLDAMKYDKKSSALSELKAKRLEKERRDAERAKKQKQEKGKGDDDSDSGSPDKSRDRKKGRSSRRRSRSRSRSSSSSGPAYRKSARSSSSSSRSSKSRSRSGSSSGSASDTERFHKLPSRQTQKYIETQEDLEAIRLSRFKFERFVHLPFFKKLIAGCFVRIGIRSHEGRPVYRMAEIIDVVETAKIYVLGKARTNLGVKLKFGKNERVFRLEFISNSAITPNEFEKWKSACQEAGISFPTLEFVKTKSAEIKKALSYEYTSDDVDKIIAQKEKFLKHPVNYAMHKARLMKERDAAITTGDEERAREFDEKLNTLEERAEELDRKRTSTISSVSLINDRNRKANVSKAEVAIKREIQYKRMHGPESNPFIRRKCNPRIVTKNKEEQINEEDLIVMATQGGEMKENKKEEEAKAEAKRKAEAAAAEESAAKKKKTGSQEANKKEDLFDAHNFDIEIDVDTSVGGPAAASKPILSTSLGLGKDGVGSGLGPIPTKRSLNLDDYKKKRGLI